MAQSDAGRVIILPKGEYSATANYEILDLVTYASSTWLCKQSCIGITPTEGAYWMLFGSAAQIATGDTVGLVKPDGTTITIDADGTIHGAGGDAEDISFDPPEGMEADNVQDALTEEFGTLSLHDERITALEEGGEVTALDTWLNKGNITTKYSTLADVLVSQSTINQLMRLHASVDYLVTWSAEDSSIIATFCGNKNAMDAIGEYDYASDKLLAVTAWKTAILASAYVESVLKDHVPTMTSNTSPSGVASADGTQTNRYPYYAFDGSADTYWGSPSDGATQNYNLSYKFEQPINIRKFHISIEYASNLLLKEYDIWGSNDGTTKTVLFTEVLANTTANKEIDRVIDNNNYYLYYGITTKGTYASNYVQIKTLQFLGRKMSIYVPKMTSNTTPWGEASASASASGKYPYSAFDGDDSTEWASGVATNARLSYDFGKDVLIKAVSIKAVNAGGARVKNFDVQVGESYTTVYSGTNPNDGNLNTFTFDNSTLCKKISLLIKDNYTDGGCSVYTVQFYGSDYSESIRATDVVLSDGTSVEDAIENIGGTDFSWKLCGSASGTNSVSISGIEYSELLIISMFQTNKYIWNIPKAEVTSEFYGLNGYNFNNTRSTVTLHVTTTSVNIVERYENGNDRSTSQKLTVYYR